MSMPFYSPRITSPVPAIVKEVINETLITCTVRGRIFEVTIADESIVPEENDTVIIELMPASKQWLVLVIVPPD